VTKEFHLPKRPGELLLFPAQLTGMNQSMEKGHLKMLIAQDQREKKEWHSLQIIPLGNLDGRIIVFCARMGICLSSTCACPSV